MAIDVPNTAGQDSHIKQPLFVARPAGWRVLAGVIRGFPLWSITTLAVAAYIWSVTDGWEPKVATALIIPFVDLVVAIPLRYEVWPERLRIVFPLWRWNVPFETISSIDTGRWRHAFFFMGVRFITAPGRTVVIRRKRGKPFIQPSLVVCPSERDEFVRQAQAALDASLTHDN